MRACNELENESASGKYESGRKSEGTSERCQGGVRARMRANNVSLSRGLSCGGVVPIA